MIQLQAKAMMRAGAGRALLELGLLPRLRSLTSLADWPMIVYYHRVSPVSTPDLGLTVSPGNFERQVNALKTFCTVVPLEELLDRWTSGVRRPDEVAITFDDGYRDNYQWAFPILRSLDVTATIFVTTDYVGSTRQFWWDQVALWAGESRRVGPACLGECRPLLPEAVARAAEEAVSGDAQVGLLRLIDALKTVAASRRAAVVDLLVGAAKGESSETARAFLTWDEIREMHRAGLGIGSHTHTHAILTELEPGDLARELATSRRLLEEHLRAPVNTLAYPDGCVNRSVEEAASAAGYRFAVQTHRSVAVAGDGLAVPRTRIKEGHSVGPGGAFSPGALALQVFGVGDALFLRSLRGKNPYTAKG
jgi:peptidoglycan/xylan/chitin deacetylase (PgdA/CDA1 family)